ncbi:MAG TPA: DUF2950 domain-containing protein, partial [Clostridia bacterium]|nr:DUF2950 domain-containing protein [Clostridia bacterium]
KQPVYVMNSIVCHSKRLNRFVWCPLLVATFFWVAEGVTANGAAAGRTFRSPEEAVGALSTAVKARDTNALATIFGPAIADIMSPDPVQAQNELDEFAERLTEANHIERADNGRRVLEIGQDRWPFAIPIAQKGKDWFFDTEAGKEELINRRIGRNELDALKSVRAYVEAQREYAGKDRDFDEVLEYAQKFFSTPGTKDGLYWPAPDGDVSPLGPLFAEAQSLGYLTKPRDENDPQPFNGYFFKILTEQGKHAPGGAYNDIINGNMIAGFGLVAWPADYGDSGVMTFIINQQGKVYQKDLGRETPSIIKDMNAYNPDPSWKPSKE